MQRKTLRQGAGEALATHNAHSEQGSVPSRNPNPQAQTPELRDLD